MRGATDSLTPAARDAFLDLQAELSRAASMMQYVEPKPARGSVYARRGGSRASREQAPVPDNTVVLEELGRWQSAVVPAFACDSVWSRDETCTPPHVVENRRRWGDGHAWSAQFSREELEGRRKCFEIAWRPLCAVANHYLREPDLLAELADVALGIRADLSTQELSAVTDTLPSFDAVMRLRSLQACENGSAVVRGVQRALVRGDREALSRLLDASLRIRVVPLERDGRSKGVPGKLALRARVGGILERLAIAHPNGNMPCHYRRAVDLLEQEAGDLRDRLCKSESGANQIVAWVQVSLMPDYYRAESEWLRAASSGGNSARTALLSIARFAVLSRFDMRYSSATRTVSDDVYNDEVAAVSAVLLGLIRMPESQWRGLKQGGKDPEAPERILRQALRSLGTPRRSAETSFEFYERRNDVSALPCCSSCSPEAYPFE